MQILKETAMARYNMNFKAASGGMSGFVKSATPQAGLLSGSVFVFLEFSDG